MAWNEKDAKKRVDENDFHDFDLEVADLSKKMDFANLGTKDVRRADAAHLYADIPNFHSAVADAGGDKQKQKKLVRAASVLRKVQGDMLKSADFVGDEEIGRIQHQAARLHALCFKPYDDKAKRARHSVVMAVSLNTFVYSVFNEVFPELRNFQSAVGVASGRCLIANIGFHGDRERICLGTPANLAAKIIGSGGTITITQSVYDSLVAALKAEFSEVTPVAGEKVYQAKGLRWDTRPELAMSLEVTWKAEKWKKTTEAYRDELPLDDMEVRWAETKIDLEKLTERESRRTDAIAIYADLDGFTQYVQEAEENDEVVSLVRELHMIRRELHAVLKTDYPGVVLQHQGDRVFAILHEPCGDDDKEHETRCRKALDAAIGVQSSMKHVLRPKLTNRENLHVAVGLDVGVAIVSRLGKKGKREVVALGPNVTAAEGLQLATDGQEIRISTAVYKTLSDGVVRDEFVGDGDSYVATDLTFPKIEDLEVRRAAKAGRLGAKASAERIEVVTNSTQPSQPWRKS